MDETSTTPLTRSRQRVADHGEVFTPSWVVEAMLDLVKEESERIDSRFLEPACGSGNFLLSIVRRKLSAVEYKYGKSPFERKHYALLALMSVYGVELLADNVSECRENVLDIFCQYLEVKPQDLLYAAGAYVLRLNIVHGDAMKMLDHDGKPIVFPEWGYLGKGKFQRRDFRLDVLTGSGSASGQGSLFEKSEIFTPIKSFKPMTIDELAQSDMADSAEVP